MARDPSESSKVKPSSLDISGKYSALYRATRAQAQYFLENSKRQLSSRHLSLQRLARKPDDEQQNCSKGELARD
jgi:hypothetical protein